MSKLLKLLDGKKSYIVAAALGLLVALEAAGVPVPMWAYKLLGAGGVVAARSALKKLE